MLNQYLKFFLNGGVLGVAACVLQWFIYGVIESHSGIAYGIATALAYVPLVVTNFLIQQAWIFKASGGFARFLTANIAIMILVSLLSPICRHFINDIFGAPWGGRCGFFLAALLGSIPSYLLGRIWVFGDRP